MRQISGLKKIRQLLPERFNPQKLAEIMLADLRLCQCRIYGNIGDNDRVLLAELNLLPESLSYDNFDQRIDLCVAGPILRVDCVPLTYILQGELFAISGRCSMIGKVCGVDLYLQHSYTGVVGDIARQKFFLPLKPLMQEILI